MIHGIGGFISFMVLWWLINGAIKAETRNQAMIVYKKMSAYNE